MTVKNSTSHHQVTFDFPIKSIIPGRDDGLLLIETVNTAKKEQTLLLLSLMQLEIIQALAFDANYPGMVVKSYDTNKLLLIQYSDQNNPDQTNIYTFSWHGGNPVFSLMNSRIIKSGFDWILVPHPHFANKELYIDLNSGSELKGDRTPDDSPDQDRITYATAYPDSSDYFQWFVQYFSNHNIIPCRQIEYLKTDQFILISFYQEEEEGALSNSLAILNTEGKILECILLDEQLPGIGKDTFFVFRNKAIFVSQKVTLNIYEL